MTDITLGQARSILQAALRFRQQNAFNPLAVAVLDRGANLVAFEREDGAAFGRYNVAFGKAYGALALGMGSRSLMNRAVDQPYFVLAAAIALPFAVVPVPGGVIVRKDGGAILGAVGISGDSSENDESAAKVGIESAGLTADTG